MLIKKSEAYSEHDCVTGLDSKRNEEFNRGKEIEVSSEELASLNKNWVVNIEEIENAS